MSTTINTGWLKDNNGDKFAPKTLSSQIVTNEGNLFEDEIRAQLENIDGGIEITKADYDLLSEAEKKNGTIYFITDIDYIPGEGGGSGTGSNIAADIIYDNTESGLESNNIQDAIDEIAAGACFADGIVVNVEMANWIAQEDGTYTNTVAIEGILESEMYDISLYGDSTEEQAYAYDFLVTDIDTYDGQVVLTASEEITVAFSVILRGKVNLENKNVYVSDLSATNIEYDNSESNMEATDMQNAIDELATSVKGIVVPVTTDSWDLQSNGSYKKVIAVDGLTGNEVLDTCLNPGVAHTEEQIIAFSELVTSIETAEGRIILTASEAITVEFSILLYGKVGFEVSVVENNNGGGSGNANIVKLTQSEYNALPESKKSDGILYAITDGECSASGGSSKPVELTKAEYEALGDKVNSDGILYAITDGDGLSAKSMAFDDTETQLGVNNVQDAIVEQNKKLNNPHLLGGYVTITQGDNTIVVPELETRIGCILIIASNNTSRCAMYNIVNLDNSTSFVHAIIDSATYTVTATGNTITINSSATVIAKARVI